MVTARKKLNTLIHASSRGQRWLAATTLPLLTLAQPALAGVSGNITFSPADVAAVPALGGTLLLLLAALLALIAIKAYRRAGQGIAPMLAGALALGSLASTGGGIELIQPACSCGIHQAHH